MKKAFFILCLSTLLLTSLPLAFGLKSSPLGMEFLGRRYLNSQDTPTYFSFIEQAKQGRLLFQNLYTSETPNLAFFRPSYFLIGQVARIFGLSSPWAFHFFRLLAGILFLLTAYFFFSFFFSKNNQRLLALTILVFSSGFGFALEKLIPETIDLWVPEANSFLTLADSPHFILSQILMIIIFFSFLLAQQRKRLWPIFLGGAASALLAFDHPFDLPIIYLTFFFFLLTKILEQNKIPKTHLRTIFLLLLPSLLGIIYYFFLLKNPVIAAWSNQNIMSSPSIWAYLSGFGFLLPLSLLAIPRLLRDDEEKGLLILSWVLAIGLLLYSPVVFQRRFVEGIHLPLTIMATLGLLDLLSRFDFFLKKAQIHLLFWRPIIITLVIILLSLTNIKTLIRDTQVFAKERPEEYYYYLLHQEMDGFWWLKENTSAKDLILTSWFYGNLIPGFTGRQVYLGHKVQTIDFEKKRTFLDSFFTTLSDAEREKFLKEAGIDYLFFGKDDYFLRLSGFAPQEKSYLRQVYAKDGVQIFAVILKS